MAAKKKKPAVQPRPLGTEPEELRLWRQIIGYRDVLSQNAARWADQLAGQRRAHAKVPIEALPEPSRAASRETRKRSNALVAGIADSAQSRLLAFDATISSLRSTKSKTYALTTLEKVAESFEVALLSEALARVTEFIKNPSEETKIQAQAAIECARDTTPRAVDVQSEVHKILEAQADPDLGDRVVAAMWPEKVFKPIDVSLLLEDARAARTAKNESSAAVARRVVATALGRKPHERKLRR